MCVCVCVCVCVNIQIDNYLTIFVKRIYVKFSNSLGFNYLPLLNDHGVYMYVCVYVCVSMYINI